MGGMGDALGQLGQSTGVSNLGQGVSDLFTGGNQAMTPGQVAGAVMPSDSLFGMPTPPRADIAPTPSPNFVQGFLQGFTGQTPGAAADFPMSPGTQMAGGVGQLFHAINALRNPGGLIQNELMKLVGGTPGAGGMPGAGGAQTPIVNLAPKSNVPSVDVAQNPYVQTQSKPGLIDSIIKGLTYGIISSGGSTP